MDWELIALISIHGVIWGIGFILLIYLFFRRLKIRKNEDFEKRDN